jgi:undecaprenyl-diphosphatase
MIHGLAQFIGIYILELFFMLVIVVLLVIVLGWRLFEAYYRRLWEFGSIFWHYVASLPFVEWLQQHHPRVWSFLGGRLSPDNYLGLHLTLGLLLSLVALNVFTELTESVTEQEELAQFDLALATALHQNTSPDQVATFRVITDLGNGLVLTALGVGVGVVLLIRRHWLLLASWLLTLAGGSLLNILLKAIFQRTRPEFVSPFVVEPGWSFPSGHAMGSLITYGLLAYLLVLVLPRYLKLVIVMAIVSLVLLIGFSRLYLGVHYFSDVVAGYAAGAVWLATSISGTEVARRRQQVHPSLQSPS